MALNIKYIFSIFQEPKQANVGTVAARGTIFITAELAERAKKNSRRWNQESHNDNHDPNHNQLELT